VITITVGSVSGDGTLGVALAPSPTITDTIGNGLTNFSPTSTVAESYTIDNSAPTAVSILRNAAELTTDGSVTFDVVFNESVQNVSVDDFVVTGAATGTIASVTGSGSAYMVTLSSVAGDGALGLSYAGAQNISDAGGNAFAGSLPVRNESYAVDKQCAICYRHQPRGREPDCCWHSHKCSVYRAVQRSHCGCCCRRLYRYR
jgi:hypothetical protein